MIGISKVSKHFDEVQALAEVNLDIATGEFISIVGPSGCGKSTLLRIITDLVPTDASVTNPKKGAFVFQDSALLPWRTVQGNVELLMELEHTDNKRAKAAVALRQVGLNGFERSYPHQLSGGMKRRVLIAKALAHEPRVLFLDEPSAGEDVELRRDMWKLVSDLKSQGVTIILTTHYIEEAEAIADRVGVISKGKLILLEEKKALMKRMGRKKVEISLQSPIAVIPAKLQNFDLDLSDDGLTINYLYDAKASSNEITKLLNEISISNLQISDLKTSQSSLEEIFVSLIEEPSK